MGFVLPTDDDLNEAIEAQNATLIAQYAVATQQHRNLLAKQQPSLIEAAANAKRDLDVNKAAIKSADEIVKLCQSVMKTIRSPY